MGETPRKWTDLPATAQVNAALRRAAAGVCGFTDLPEWWEVGPLRHRIYKEWPEWPEWDDEVWTPDQSRDDLARVFMSEAVHDWVETRNRKDFAVNDLWGTALTAPRTALCQLLDLLAISVPEGVK